MNKHSKFRKAIVFDCEVYPNYFCIALKSTDGAVNQLFEMRGEDMVAEEEYLKDLKQLFEQRECHLAGFNCQGYDLYIIKGLMRGLKVKQLYKLSQALINGERFDNDRVKQYAPKHDCGIIDIMAIIRRGMPVGLKTYGLRINFNKIAELPLPPDSPIDLETGPPIVREYCKNDVELTLKLLDYIKEEINLRIFMGNEYYEHLLASTEPQVAEKVIKNLMHRNYRIRPRKPVIKKGVFNLEPHEDIQFNDPGLKKLLEDVKSCEFSTNDYGKVVMPARLANRVETYAGKTYKMGIGGLHSQEKKRCIKATDEWALVDADFKSYYPMIISKLGVYPESYGPKFVDEYRRLLDKRLEMLREDVDKSAAYSLKITLNGTFGKMNSPYSMFYSPKGFLSVTLSGQLYLMSLIEYCCEQFDAHVLSANTDGIVCAVRRSQIDQWHNSVRVWAEKRQFQMDFTEYSTLVSKDVNNYLAIVPGGGCKSKGAFDYTVSPHSTPQGNAIWKALNAKIINGIDISETIHDWSMGIEDFLFTRTSKSNVMFTDEMGNETDLGKHVRWYWSKREGHLRNEKGVKLPKTGRTYPCLDTTKYGKQDVDVDRYIQEANKIASEIGIDKSPVPLEEYLNEG